MRLIDADDATRVAESVLKKYGLDRESVITDEIHDAIDNIKTAYDVESVVKRFENMRDNVSCNIKLNSQSYDIKYEVERNEKHYNKIIEIIRNGEQK